METKNTKKKNLYIFIGRTSSGKTTIAKEVSKGMNIPILKEVTTRPMRDNENGSEYHFMSSEEFNNRYFCSEFIEVRKYPTVHGIWCYANLKSTVLGIDKDSILITTPKACKEILELIKTTDIVAHVFYIYVDSSTRIERVFKRGDNRFEITRREESDNIDFATVLDLQPEVIYNNAKLERVVADVELRIKRQRYIRNVIEMSI